jgi:tetratricopeptide (TPR) repeat protein
MSSTTLLERLKRARIVQVLAVYLGASWVVLQIAEVLAEALSLPEWVLPVCVILLLVGLLIILATAWIQSLASTSAAEEAGEVPTDWQIAPADVLDSLKSGKVPHLTWGRAILGGVMALSILFGGAGVYVLLTGGRAPVFAPTEAGASVAAAGIAVLPFSVTGGAELELWREGMVDLMSTNLDGMGGYRTIDARTVMARWRERVDDGGDPDLNTALRVAGATGARFGLVGNLVGNPGGVRVTADVYDLSNGEKITQSYVEGPADSVLVLVSRLTVGLTRDLLAKTGQQVIQAPRTAGITTESLEALRHYLDGEAAFRKGDFATASAAFERAVDADSTFALAWYRLSHAYGWMENLNSEAAARAGERLETLADRLPLRERTLMVASSRGMREGDLSALGDLRQAASKYPDDPEVWFELGEFYRHVGVDAGVATDADALEAFEKAVELDPTFAPFYIHYIESLLGAGRAAEAAAALDSYRAMAGPDAQPHLTLAVALFGQDEALRQETLATLDTVPEQVVFRMGAEIPLLDGLDPGLVLKTLEDAYRATGSESFLTAASEVKLRQGRVTEVAAQMMDPSFPPILRVSFVAALGLMGIEAPEPLQNAVDDLNVCPDREDAGEWCMYHVGALAALRGDRSTWQTWVDRNHALGERYQAEGQGAHGLEHEALARALEGIWTMAQEGDPAGAVEMLKAGSNRLPGEMAYLTRFKLAEALAPERPREAIEVLEVMTSGPFAPFAQVRLGHMKESLGDTASASLAYQRAVELFAEADEDLSYAREAREGLARLGS